MSGYSPVLSTIALLFGGLVVFVIVGAVIIGVLASGDAGDPPGKCHNTAASPDSSNAEFRDAPTAPALAQQWQQKWDQLNAQLDAGTPASVTFDEGEITSRVAQWVDDTGAPLEDVTICIYDSRAQARAHAEIPVLADIPLTGGVFETEVSAVGRTDLGGQHPEITVVEIDAGDLPDWSTDPVQDDLEEIVNDRLADYDIDHTYEVAYREGQIEITGQP